MLSDIRVLVFHKNKKNFLKRCTVVMCHQHGMSWKKRRLVCNKSLYLVFNFIHHRVCEMCSTWVQIQQMAAVQITKFNIHLIHFMLFDCLLPMHIDVWAEWSVSQWVMRSALAACTDPRDHVVKGKLYKSANAVSTLRLPLVSHIQAVIHCLLSSHQQVSIVQKVHFAVVCRRV